MIQVTLTLSDSTQTILRFESGEEFTSWTFTEEALALGEFEFTSEDISEQVRLELLLADLECDGRASEEACFGCVRIIGGYNERRNLPSSRVIEMANTFSQIESCLNRRMPKTAKALINALAPNEDLVTSELKSLLLMKLKDY